jgi:hypothetical protein
VQSISSAYPHDLKLMLLASSQRLKRNEVLPWRPHGLFLLLVLHKGLGAAPVPHHRTTWVYCQRSLAATGSIA